LEAAVLIEAGWKSLVDTVWVTVVPIPVAKERLMTRNNLSEEEAEKRIMSQLTNEERLKHANVVIDTNGPFEETERKVTEAWTQMLAKSTL
jgi:phosphopantetheine adenylyltransferase/dephospho-CoA kinase